MNNERRQLQMPFLCCALVLLCSCIFCWEALGRPVRVQLNNSLDIVPFLTACGFFCGCILCTLMRRASLCLRLLSACLLFGVGLTLASFTQVSPLYFCLTFCLIGGAGAGMTFCLCVLVVFCWMPARRGLGFGALCGSAFLSIALVDATVPHLFQDPSFGWHGAYLLFGLIAATALFVAAFTLRLPDNISEISGSHAMRPMELVCLVCLAAAFAAEGAAACHAGVYYLFYRCFGGDCNCQGCLRFYLHRTDDGCILGRACRCIFGAVFIRFNQPACDTRSRMGKLRFRMRRDAVSALGFHDGRAVFQPRDGVPFCIVHSFRMRCNARGAHIDAACQPGDTACACRAYGADFFLL